MAAVYGLWWLFLLSLLRNADALKMSSPNIKTKCLGNILRVDVRPLPGQFLEVSVVVGNAAIKLTQSLAARCGFSMSHKQGTISIYASLQNCFAQNMGDEYTTVINLRLFSNTVAQDVVYQVAETCNYNLEASREIICDRNYMEVSVKRTVPNDYTLPYLAAPEMLIDSGFRMSSLVFFTPEKKMMTPQEAHNGGYGVANTATRLILRSSKSAPETYIQHVAGVPMTVLQASAIFAKKWLKSKLDVAAACPQREGSVYFTENMISWFLPTRIDPLISSSQFRLLEVHIGVDGRRLNADELSARRYNVTVDNMYIMVQIPIGAPGGFFMSILQNDKYFISYVIEPMIELLWIEDANDDTRYKVLQPIVTPAEHQPLKVQDKTIPKDKVFKLIMGPLAGDVILRNITFNNEVLSVSDLIERGFNVQERRPKNSSLKFILLQVPFSDRVVKQETKAGVTTFSLHLIFGLVVLPKFIVFSHTASLEAELASVVPSSTVIQPLAVGGCDSKNFYILVKYGTEGHNFHTRLGKRTLTQSLAQEYSFTRNRTHFSIVVPFTSPDVVYEAIVASNIRSRLEVTLLNPETDHNVNDFTLTCRFPSTLVECLPNGTMTALAVKLESVPSLNPSELTLLDPTCTPVYSDDRLAYFVFTGSTCGTTRKFVSNSMLYENEIALPHRPETRQMNSSDDEPEYDLRVSCSYDLNTNRSLAFHNRPRRTDRDAENGIGELQVVLRLAEDDSYSSFYGTTDYPISKYLQEPLYFEVELMRSTNLDLSLELETCWATLDKDKRSQPRWNLIIKGCPNPVDPNQVIFHPVRKNDRVEYPSHVKRFEVRVFAFAADKNNLKKQLYVHCDVVMCDSRNRRSEGCKKRSCDTLGKRNKVQKRAASNVQNLTSVSSGCIHLY
ncbi:uncharacterized protein [Syngnathus scovelli]|uniref:uncharacterized protein isoform X2 n=1 Tax=Syngnathus scovelli TaxID=161590 RepID=UPI00210FF817|nr:uncharacterized protein LOC125990267 isoform X2 [Syngnathus scovelli]